MAIKRIAEQRLVSISNVASKTCNAAPVDLTAEKVLQAGIPTQELRSLAGGNDVGFYVELKMKDGTTRYINRDGQPFNNFCIPYYAVAGGD